MKDSDMRERRSEWSPQADKGNATRSFSRRRFVERVALVTIVMLAAIPSRRNARAQTKMSQQQAGYQDQPKGEQRCADCRHFVEEQGACRLVDGSISPDGWCTLWAAKA